MQLSITGIKCITDGYTGFTMKKEKTNTFKILKKTTTGHFVFYGCYLCPQTGLTALMESLKGKLPEEIQEHCQLFMDSLISCPEQNKTNMVIKQAPSNQNLKNLNDNGTETLDEYYAKMGDPNHLYGTMWKQKLDECYQIDMDKEPKFGVKEWSRRLIPNGLPGTKDFVKHLASDNVEVPRNLGNAVRCLDKMATYGSIVAKGLDIPDKIQNANSSAFVVFRMTNGRKLGQDTKIAVTTLSDFLYNMHQWEDEVAEKKKKSKAGTKEKGAQKEDVISSENKIIPKVFGISERAFGNFVYISKGSGPLTIKKRKIGAKKPVQDEPKPTDTATTTTTAAKEEGKPNPKKRARKSVDEEAPKTANKENLINGVEAPQPPPKKQQKLKLRGK